MSFLKLAANPVEASAANLPERKPKVRERRQAIISINPMRSIVDKMCIRDSKEVKEVIAKAEQYISNGQSVVVYTSRELVKLDTDDKDKILQVSVDISNAVVRVIGDLTVKPSFIVAKGGITSSDVGTKALRVKKATVMGQIKPGIPVWMTGEESKFPNMPYVIFPGNVGEVTTLREAVEILMG